MRVGVCCLSLWLVVFVCCLCGSYTHGCVLFVSVVGGVCVLPVRFVYTWVCVVCHLLCDAVSVKCLLGVCV